MPVRKNTNAFTAVACKIALEDNLQYFSSVLLSVGTKNILFLKNKLEGKKIRR